ncbi:hypothetical protein Pan97_18730 [Bremerella volcania]|uniref:Carboxypeptidase regulatory-like domain-containing protein n=1 Tax=Bremerella volcania TaxID=2527984 RepID=A0A518C6K1_9BACT|nr:hypothetical protein [Bremerella volcania]QDU74855.1 hypothetical protein Pan97_18730 [Bremerella volcania]
MRLAMPLLCCLCVIGLIGCLTGCGESTPSLNPGVDVYKTQVKVVQDGQPVEGAKVAFSAKGQQRGASGITNADGIAQLTTFDLNDGAVAGEHMVKISKEEVQVLKEADPDDPLSVGQTKVVQHLPVKYSRFNTSGLSATVTSTEAGNTFEFEIK